MKQKSLATMLTIGMLAMTPAFGQSTQGQGQGSQGTSGQSADRDRQGGQGSQGQGSQGATGQGADRQRQSGQASQEGQGSASRTGSANRMGADSGFVMKAAQSGMAEVKLGQLGAEKATNEEVKAFAKKMVDDHTKANDELKQLAGSKGINLPADPDSKHQSAHDKLSKMSGADFDRAFMQQMVADHRNAVNEFRRESKSGSDAELKAWAAKTLPDLEGHLQQAEAIHGKVKK